MLMEGRCDSNGDGDGSWWLVASLLCCMAEMTMVVLIMTVGGK